MAAPRFTGTPFIRAWNADDYGAAPVNWRVARHPRSGFIYIANNFGVLEFDGAAWRLISMPSEGPARTLTINNAGEIWVGGYDEVCVLQPNAKGEIIPIDALRNLPEKERTFGQLLHCLATPEGVYFASAIKLLLFRPDGTVKTWPLDLRINGMWWQQDRLHVSLGVDSLGQLTDTGIAILKKQPTAQDSESASAFRVLASRDQADGSTLLLTARGPYRWRGSGHPLEPISPSAAANFSGSSAITATFLADGRLAFGFLNEGLLFLDGEGNFISRLTRVHGLPSNRLEHIATDPEGGLWIAQRIGITRAQVDDGIVVHHTAQGLTGSPRSMHRLGSRLYIAHNEGGAWRDDATGQIHELTGLQSGLNTFLQVGDKLFATGTAIFEIMPDNSVQRRLSHVLTSLEALPSHPGFFIGGSTSGLWLFRFDGVNWHQVGKISTVPEGITSIYADEKGEVWCAPYSGRGAWRLRFGREPKPDVEAVFFGEAQGLPTVRRRDELRFCKLGGELLATTGQWVHRYDVATGRFLPMPITPGNTGPIAIATSSDGDMWWFLGSPEAQLARATVRDGKIELTRVAGGPITDLIANSIYYDDVTQSVWISGQGALVSVDLRWRASGTTPPLRAMVRRISTPTGETLYANSGLDPAPPLPPALDHRLNALRFSFAAPTQTIDYRGRTGTLYRTQLEGLDNDWTGWSTNHTREFTNLPYRNLVFHVQARELSGRVSADTSLEFTIQSPWWLSNYAVIGYAFTGALGFFGIVKLRTRALTRRAAELSVVINSRTEELATRNRELARLHKLEFSEKTAARLGEEKAQLEMLRYQLNPHFLYNALGSIRSLIHSRPDEADEMTTQLADFCRMTLTRGEGEGGTLATELRMISSYLDMERTRWRELLKTRIDAAPDTLTLRVPPFLLLPLVENAIKYGTRTSVETVEVVITVRRLDTSGVYLEVANTGRWVEPTGTRTPFSTGIGLDNLRERLQRYFPNAHEFAVNADAGWVRVSLKISSTENFKPMAEHA
ncbi:histidine kinase [Oleiharenicola lentus]|uniref:sensor histidine kinase n=1 Tax=Oleiharenicola lentus TaxID=2508720 RepID=UPI003F66C57A